MTKNRLLTKLLPFTNPFLLTLTGLSYTLGVGIARYLGRADSPLSFWLGLGWILLLALAMNLLTVYFTPHNEPILAEETIKERNWVRAALFQISMALLGGVALFTIALFQSGINIMAIIFAVIIFILAIIYALPPMRVVTSGFGEQLLAILITIFTPAFSLTIQMGDVHRLLSAVISPLALLAVTAFLVLNFPTYKEDLKYERGSLLLRIGWERAISLHHILILTAYFLFAAMPLFGFPRALFAPVFYVAPLAFFQIYWMQKIAQGASPNWKFLKFLAYSVIGLTLYTLTVTFWMR
ncbi:MAG: hypothetical protein HN392_01725 [Anaerolineae bacterium]|jgi:1,4-dihydroxy-2-naphthoate octaprenyltransferase|nr:hypothetical protein [Anaerolineae bacterium]MBT7989151.1 hypothetical protein [Anaerolineae bacterium]